MKLSDIEMDFGPKPIPEAILKQEQDPKDKNHPPIKMVIPALKNPYGVFDAFFVAWVNENERETWISTFWSPELVKLRFTDVEDFSSDGEYFYLRRNGGKQETLTAELILPVRAKETGFRAVKADNLLFTPEEEQTYDPKLVLENAVTYPMRVSARQHMFVVAEVPKGISKLYVVRTEPLTTPGMGSPRNIFEEAIVFNGQDQVRRGLVYANGSALISRQEILPQRP